VTCAQSIEATEVRLKAKEKELIVLETDLRGRAIAAQQDLEESEKRLAEAEAVVRKGGADIDRRSTEVDALKAKVERQEPVGLVSFRLRLESPFGRKFQRVLRIEFFIFPSQFAGNFPTPFFVLQEVKREGPWC
jgi:hypothetical protein